MTAPVRPLTMCAGCGAIVSRHEDCPECGEDPNADTMPCEDCGGTGEFETRIRHVALNWMVSPDDGVETGRDACGFCNGAKEVSRPFARASELWAEGFEHALWLRESRIRLICSEPAKVFGKPWGDGLTAGLAYLDSLPAHRGFEPPPRPVFRPTVEQMDAWAAQRASYEALRRGLCRGCGDNLSRNDLEEDTRRVFGAVEPGVCTFCMAALCDSKGGRRLERERFWTLRSPINSRPPVPSVLWRRFDAGEMRDLDFRFDGGAA